MLDRVQSLLGRCSTDKSCLPPTLLYNEGWMLRLSLSLLEEVIGAIRAKDSESGASLERFYKLCLRFARSSRG